MDIHDYQSLLKPQPIASLQIHLYDGKDMIFTNTLLRQSAKLIAPSLTPSFILHPDPLTTFGSPPFCILNQVHVKNREELYKLVITLAELSQQQERQGEQRVAQQNSLLLHTVLRHFEELSQVATAMSEDDLNPYWTLLNPVLRFRHSRQIKSRKQKLYRSTQFFTKNELNADYFLHRLNVLEEYTHQLKKQRLHGLCTKFIKICQISLLKHAQENSQKIFKVLIEQPSLLQINQHKLTFLVDLQQYHQNAVRDKKKVAGVYGSFRLPGEAEPQPQKEEEYTTMNEKWVRALIKPASATVLLFLMMFVIKK